MDNQKRQKLIDMGMYPIDKSKPKSVKLDKFNPHEIKFTDFYDWINLAFYINVPDLLKEKFVPLSVQIRDKWFYEKIDYWKVHGRWNLELVELIIVLYLHHNEMRFDPAGQNYDLINSVLVEIAEQTNNSYQPNEEDRKWIQKQNKEEITAFFNVISSPSDEGD